MLAGELTATRTVANQVADAIDVIRDGFHKPYTPVKTEITGVLHLIEGTAEYGFGRAMRLVGKRIEGESHVEHGKRLIQLGGWEFLPGAIIAANIFLIGGLTYLLVTDRSSPLDPVRVEIV